MIIYKLQKVTRNKESCSWRGLLDKTLCDKVCQWLATGQWFSPGTPVSSTNKTDRYDITEILLLKVALRMFFIVYLWSTLHATSW
jgi:hypothetical protein